MKATTKCPAFYPNSTLALREIRDDIGQTVFDTLQSSQSPSVEAVLTGLLNEVATIPDDFIVVLDDYHSIVAQSVHDALAYVLEHMPPQMHLVIATRVDPPLPPSRLRVKRPDDRGARRRSSVHRG